MQTIGIVSAGEMGAALGRELLRTGHTAVTTLAGRSSGSADRARAAGLETVASLDEVVQRADVLLSCVPPAEAVRVAEEVAPLSSRDRRPILYVDLNSIAPSTVLQVEERVRREGVTFADATIHGTSRRLGDLAVLYASGPGAARVAELFAPILPVEQLGSAPGRASAFKMLLGGVSKSLVAMMVEVGCAADRQQLLPQFLQACHTFYPGVMQAVDRTVTSYAQHAGRRADEVGQIECLFQECGLQADVVAATRRVLVRLAASAICQPEPYPAQSIADLLSRAHALGVCDEGVTQTTS